MKTSLCGKNPCPGICSRVCHCPAGLARSRQLAGMLRNRRLALRSGLRTQGGLPPEQWAEVEFISQTRHNFGVLHQPNRKKPSQDYPTHIEPKPSVPYTSWAKQWLAPVSVSVILAIMGLVVFFGIVANQGNFAPGYEPPQTYHWGSK